MDTFIFERDPISHHSIICIESAIINSKKKYSHEQKQESFEPHRKQKQERYG